MEANILNLFRDAAQRRGEVSASFHGCVLVAVARQCGQRQEVLRLKSIDLWFQDVRNIPNTGTALSNEGRSTSRGRRYLMVEAWSLSTGKAEAGGPQAQAWLGCGVSSRSVWVTKTLFKIKSSKVGGRGELGDESWSWLEDCLSGRPEALGLSPQLGRTEAKMGGRQAGKRRAL